MNRLSIARRALMWLVVGACLVPVGVPSAIGQDTPVGPDGCPLPDRVIAVFLGRVEAKDWRSARFSVSQVRAGSLDGFAVGALVDVDFYDDVRFLEVGERYVVSAGQDPRTRRLVSKVRESEPRFGGSQVVALDQVDCPAVEDPIRTLDVDGTPVESGVLTPLYGEGRAILAAVVFPLLWAFGLLLVLTGLKAFLVWMIKKVAPSRPRSRSRPVRT